MAEKHRIGARCLVALAIAGWFCSAAAPPARAATPAKVDRAVKRGINYLYSRQQPDGSWELIPKPEKGDKEHGDDVKGFQWGGVTSIAAYALLAAGESPQDERLAKAIAFLKKHDTDVIGVYAVGMRAQVWQFLPQTPDVKACIKRDTTFLQESLLKSSNKKARGYYCYYKIPRDWDWFDRSVSQYGVLGMWACAQAGAEVSKTYWQEVEDAWRKSQTSEGGWSYNDTGDTKVTPQMVAAGVATLFITQDYLRLGDGISCKGNISNPSIDKGLAWMTANFPKWDKVESWTFYTLYGVERIGVASGYKYFGTIDWYQNGSDYLITRQEPNGSWFNGWPPDYGAISDTSWALLFLSRGRAPVVMNKLQYELAGKDGKPATANWNQRPRDVANFTAWAGKQTERYLNWQIVNLNVPVEELHDAPILYIAGNQLLNFADADVAKLRQFVEEGGLILGNADCASKDFADSFRKLGQKMFPTYEFRELPADHPIYTEQQFPRSKWKTPPSVLGLSNGVRELMLLIPSADPGKPWQMQDKFSKAELFQLGSNIFLYCIERQNLRTKGETHIVKRDDKSSPSKKIKIARLQYAGNWDPEPGGWRRLANFMHNRGKADLIIETVKLGDGKLDNAFNVAHLTGTATTQFTPEQQKELKKFVDGGGTLIIDAAGGSTAFATSAEAMLAGAFPDAAKTLAPVAKSHAAFANTSDLALRKYTAKQFGKSRPGFPRGIEADGRIKVFYSPLDLSVGIVGQSVDGVSGYDPDTATELMSAMLQYAVKK